jgi:hypothetical protein
VSRRVLQFIFLIWLCSYLAGPLVQTIDFWDTPQDDVNDIASSLCGTLIWAACAATLAILAWRELRKCRSYVVSRNLVRPQVQFCKAFLNLSFKGTGLNLVGSPPLRI